MNLQALVAQLEHAGLIELTVDPAEAAYQFRHGLIQSAAYASLLRQQRRQLHLAAGEVIESAYVAGASHKPNAADALDDIAPILAEHFSIAGDDARALRYFQLAGDAAFRRFANAEAASLYRRAVEILMRLPVTASAKVVTNHQPAAYDPGQASHLCQRLGRALELTNQYDAALAHYTKMEDLARRQADRALELAALIASATIVSTANASHDEAQGRALLERASALAQELDDASAAARLEWTLMLHNTMRGGDIGERVAHGERALGLARQHDLREQLAFTLTDIWFAYAGAGRWREARPRLEEAYALAGELNNFQLQCEAMVRLSVIHLVTGEFEASLAGIDQAYRHASAGNSPDLQGLSRAFEGLIHRERGDWDKALSVMEDTLDLGRMTNNVTVLMGTQADLGLTYGMVGQMERGLALARQAYAASEAFLLMRGWSTAALVRLQVRQGNAPRPGADLAPLPDFQALRQKQGFMVMHWASVAVAAIEAALAGGAPGSALETSDELLAVMAGDGVRYLLPDALYLRGVALLALGRLALARAALQDARAEALAIGSQRMVWHALQALADFDARSGASDSAEAFAAEADRLTHRMAERLPSEMRAGFVSQPPLHTRLLPPEG